MTHDEHAFTSELVAPPPMASIHASEGGLLPPSAAEGWRDEGYAVVRGLLPEALVEASQAALRELLDSPTPVKDFGSGGAGEFPTGTALDRVTVHPALLAAARALLGTPDIRLTQSDAWLKVGSDSEGGYAPLDNTDQRVHMDYGNHTFAHPPEWERPELVAAIVYFSDLRETGGGTAVVPRRGADDPAYAAPYVRMPGQGGIPWVNDRAHAERMLEERDPETAAFRRQLYEREVRVVDARPGDVLLYRHDVWHRGTPVRAGARRFVLNLAWRRADAVWIMNWNRAWTFRMYDGWLERFVAALAPDQRDTLGFPPVGHAYWTERTVAWVEARYPGIDMAPYRAHLAEE